MICTCVKVEVKGSDDLMATLAKLTINLGVEWCKLSLIRCCCKCNTFCEIGLSVYLSFGCAEWYGTVLCCIHQGGYEGQVAIFLHEETLGRNHHSHWRSRNRLTAQTDECNCASASGIKYDVHFQREARTQSYNWQQGLHIFFYQHDYVLFRSSPV